MSLRGLILAGLVPSEQDGSFGFQPRPGGKRGAGSGVFQARSLPDYLSTGVMSLCHLCGSTTSIEKVLTVHNEKFPRSFVLWLFQFFYCLHPKFGVTAYPNQPQPLCAERMLAF